MNAEMAVGQKQEQASLILEQLKWKDSWPHFLRMQQFDADSLEVLVDHAMRFLKAMMDDQDVPRISGVCRRNKSGKPKQRLVRTIFYQPSTRTATTFHDALVELGCIVHNVVDPNVFSSAVKGESYDAEIMAYTTAGGVGYLRGCDGIVIRHSQSGYPQRAADIIGTCLGASSNLPPIFVINAGDGKDGQHPTQALADLTTIKSMRRCDSHFLDGLTVLFPGDVARSRVINPLLYAFGRFQDRAKIKVIFCNPAGLGPKRDMLLYLARHKVGYDFCEADCMADAVREAKIVYMTRLQSEYDDEVDKASIPDFDRGLYVFRKEYLSALQPDAFVMHPLPINEDPSDPPAEVDQELIPLALAGDPRLPFPRTSHMGKPARAALSDLTFASIDVRAVCV